LEVRWTVAVICLTPYEEVRDQRSEIRRRDRTDL
jgi:hypothetical protein